MDGIGGIHPLIDANQSRNSHPESTVYAAPNSPCFFIWHSIVSFPWCETVPYRAVPCRAIRYTRPQTNSATEMGETPFQRTDPMTSHWCWKNAISCFGQGNSIMNQPTSNNQQQQQTTNNHHHHHVIIIIIKQSSPGCLDRLGLTHKRQQTTTITNYNYQTK